MAQGERGDEAQHIGHELLVPHVVAGGTGDDERLLAQDVEGLGRDLAVETQNCRGGAGRVGWAL